MPNQPAKSNRMALWAALIVIIIAAIGMAVFLLSKNNTNSNNANVKTNGTANQNANIASNTNSSSNVNTLINTNSASNTNASSNTNTTVDTSEWESYSNAQYGFSLKYPGDWKMTSISTQLVGLRPSDADYLVEGSPSYAATIGFHDAAVAALLTNTSPSEITDFTVNSMSAKRHVGNEGVVTYYFDSATTGRSFSISNNAPLLRLSNSISESELAELNALFEAILRTVNRD